MLNCGVNCEDDRRETIFVKSVIMEGMRINAAAVSHRKQLKVLNLFLQALCVMVERVWENQG
jgi:hypothetical protein